MNPELLRAKIRELIAKDEIENAIKLLTTCFKKNEQLDQLILQTGKYNALKKDQRDGVIEYEKAQRSLNLLRKHILEFTNENIDRKILTEENIFSINLKEKYKLSLARVAVLQALEGIDQGEIITTIQQLSKIKNRKFVIKVLHELEAATFIEKTTANKNTFWKLTSEGRNLAKSILSK